jgi:hypothetical protein
MSEQVNTNWDQDPYDDETELGGISAVPVRVVGQKIETLSPQFGAYSLFTVPTNASLPVQLLQRRPTRYAAYIRNLDAANSVMIAETQSKLQAQVPQGYILPAGQEIKVESEQPVFAQAIAGLGTTPNGGASYYNYNSVAGPTAGTTIVTTGVIPAGTYVVNIDTSLNGTATTADANNTQLLVGSTVIGTIMNGDSVNVNYPNSPITVVVPAGGAAILTKTIGAGSGTAAYNQSISAAPVSGSGATSAASVQCAVRDEAWLQTGDKK